jgi:hypothetical protein
MKIRLMGLPAEINQAVTVLNDADSLDVLQVSDPYPNRGDSHMVRVYIEAQLHPHSGAIP